MLRSNARDCFYLDDIRLVTGVMVLVSAPLVALIWGLSHVDDVFKINAELTTVIMVGVSIAGKPGPTFGVTVTYRRRNCVTDVKERTVNSGIRNVSVNMEPRMRMSVFHRNASIILLVSLAC